MAGNGVSDGNLANETTFNGGFISRNSPSDTISTLDLLHNAPLVSGSYIYNLQRNINQLFSSIGAAANGAYNAVITWASSVVGLSSSTIVAKIEALVLKFRDTTGNGGHAHTGVDGDGAKISVTDILNINQYRAEFQLKSITGASGSSMDVSSYFTGESSGGSSVAAGVITSAPDNTVDIFDASTLTNLEDSQGQRIYGRITYSAGTWTLAFYTNEGGSETAATLSSTNIKIYYLKVFTLAQLPTIPSLPHLGGSLDFTSDIVDASSSVRGAVSTGAQSFAGLKTFVDGIVNQNLLRGDIAVNAAATGADASIATPSKMILKVTNNTLVSIKKFSSPNASQFFVLINGTGVDIVVKNSDTAADEILTGTEADLTLTVNASLWLAYDSNSSRWRVVGGSGAGGGGLYVTDSTLTQTLSTNDEITTTGDARQLIYVQGDPGGVEASITPFGSVDLWDDGTEIVIFGRDDADFVDFNFNDANYGMVGNFDVYTLTNYKGLRCLWDKTNKRWLTSPA